MVVYIHKRAEPCRPGEQGDRQIFQYEQFLDIVEEMIPWNEWTAFILPANEVVRLWGRTNAVDVPVAKFGQAP